MPVMVVLAFTCLVVSSDVKRGQNPEAEVKASRPKLRGRGQSYEVEAEADAKNNHEKSTK